MRRLPLEHITAVDAVEKPLYFENGERVFNVGERIVHDHFPALRKVGITELWEFERGDDIAAFIRSASSETVRVDDLTASHKFYLPVYTPDGQLLVTEGTFCNPKIKTRLVQLGLAEVAVEKEKPTVNPVEIFLREKNRLSREVNRRALARMAITQAKMLLAPKAVSPGEVEKSLESEVKDAGPAGAALDRLVDSNTRSRSRADKEDSIRKYRNAAGVIEKLLENLRQGTVADGTEIVNLAREEIYQLVDDKDLLLNLLNVDVDGVSSLAHLAVKRAVVAANVASALQYGDDQVLELTVSALLADVGMLTVPADILNKKGPLDDEERRCVQAHAVAGLGLLKNVTNVPRAVMYTIFQHHERIDGSGYPKGTAKEKQHPFAPVVAVADTYAAMTTDRPWRKALLPYTAMETIIREASVRHFDSDVVRGMLRYTSLFPIGSLVELSTGAIGKVVGCKKTHYARPLVQPILDVKTHKVPRNPTIVDLSRDPTIRILRPVPHEEYANVGISEGF
ncbi:MAG: HD domain-containing protein [Planctomycetes bacterium]|nr:HD domain-containing protein [Planctomycetota bacterium]